MASLSVWLLGLIAFVIIIENAHGRHGHGGHGHGGHGHGGHHGGKHGHHGHQDSDSSEESVSITFSIYDSSSESTSGSESGSGSESNSGSGSGGDYGNQGHHGGRNKGGKQQGGKGNSNQMQFSSFSKIPKSMLSKLSSSQIENLKKQGNSGKPASNKNTRPGQKQGGGSNGQQTMQFSSFSKIPKSMLSKLSSSQIENLKKQGNSGKPKGNSGSPGKQQGGSNQGQQAFKYSSFSQIPQSLLDKLSPAQIEHLKNQGRTNSGSARDHQIFHITSFSQVSEDMLDKITNNGETTNSDEEPENSSSNEPFPWEQNHSSEEEPETSEEPENSSSNEPFPWEQNQSSGENPSVSTFKLKPQPGQQGEQTFQYSSYSQIPQNILDQLSDDQKENIKKILSGQKPTETFKIPGTISEPQTFHFTSFSQLPPNGFNIPGYNNTQANDVLNTIFNYVSVGGQLTGIPPVDLLLLRFYMHQGPQNFCGSVM